ncbi:BTAD domain-containing putative transcriptional regulator [Streptomyces sp. NPDC059009]|uniref:BTAD domain-containing putative transcriptional regulator n=1 Tax=Streptomyces sp. NPDC059009 TaxID=3346694 RepID=UPI0036887A40
MGQVRFGVLGPVAAMAAVAPGAAQDGAGGADAPADGDGWSDGTPIALKGPRHRAVLARLIVARRRVVPVARLVEDLWEEPPPRAVGAVRTFVADLRRALEPDRPRRAPARLLVTEGPGYALRAAHPAAVDAWHFEAAVTQAPRLAPATALRRLDEALALWRGPAYAEFAEEDWARGERFRLAELRLQAGERRAEALLALGRSAEAVPDLDVHVVEHPWREDGWRLLSLALYREGRQGDALAVLRRARTTLIEQLGVEPGPALRRMEASILAQDRALAPAPAPVPASTPTLAPAQLWSQAAAAYDRAVSVGARARLESTVGLLRTLAVTGPDGLEAAREQRMAAIAAAEELGDPELTARVIGGFDVPANWTRSDDPELARRIVAAAERTLARLPDPPSPSHAHTATRTATPVDAARCRLLATVALETRGLRTTRGPEAAREAELIARRLDDPALLAFALNGSYMQSCTRAGGAPRRDAIGAELVELAARHGLVTYEVLGHLVRLQARAALADFPRADEHAARAQKLADRHELPLVGVFTQWYEALKLAASGDAEETGERAEAAYRAAAVRLDGAGMPGVRTGLLPLALLGLRLAHGRPPQVDLDQDWGPYRPWVEALALAEAGRRDAARAALHRLPEPPPDLLYEALCCLAVEAALRADDAVALERATTRLRPAAAELAGAGSGMLTFGPVARYLAESGD